MGEIPNKTGRSFLAKEYDAPSRVNEVPVDLRYMGMDPLGILGQVATALEEQLEREPPRLRYTHDRGESGNDPLNFEITLSLGAMEGDDLAWRVNLRDVLHYEAGSHISTVGLFDEGGAKIFGSLADALRKLADEISEPTPHA